MLTELSFTSADGVRLAGSVAIPTRPAEGRPGLVLVSGSGASDRHNGGLFDDLRDRLVAAGIAVLAYDKRGVGSSGGQWPTADVEVLAADAAAALALLRDHPNAVSENVGLLGHSEGGWVALRVAARLATPKHLILNSCPAVSFQRAEVYAQTRAGIDQDMAATWLNRLAQVAAAGGSLAEAQQVLDSTSDESTRAALAEQDFELTEQTWALFAAWVGYDPRGDLTDLAVPTLALFGNEDVLTPVDESRSVLHDLAAQWVRTVSFPNADHRLRAGSDYAPGYFDTIAEWCVTARR